MKRPARWPAELAMIDENLCRSELSPADRARQTARRKAIYEELNPETRPGAIRAHAANAAMGNDVDANLAATPFTADTARVTGLSKRTVQRDAERGEKVIEGAVAGRNWPALAGAWGRAGQCSVPLRGHPLRE
ncbi:hypothetical protein EET67_20665 [Pseudaminobacter arsenicus]|uniref:Uncharacterized protein n=1 Tax=Borborobacter arsenicus TaxID=1851146 RepID=A0A432V1F4_9HYPH|nr:hypothetical protein [Pseudaminobacter arsenicus]RUM95935.1 hypothetical protein EET67_20665 [Pseudaminobacter arsenicus]